ncbi:DoxX family protein [Deinococcus arenicola]|uniref:DoxX family protein n=1 Tax=Deinococcus arenicola TaxID=2994950 RepID=A0ABU4DLI7_9DEIO|nr:DoxX family protein [Deinococcus sp. ZS9-10]MDV6373213.1 DoxX family protein [Deinococcus sp. ZS9-10]
MIHHKADLNPVRPVSLPQHNDSLAWKLHLLELRVLAWWAHHGITLLRLALGVVFFWFGVQKFFPGVSVAQDLATNTISALTFGHMSPQVSLPLLATWECVIGIGLLSGRFLHLTLLLLFAQMVGTFMPLVLFPAETFKIVPWIPTLEGQYIIKNLVLLAAGLVVGATARGGRLIYSASAADAAEHTQTLHNRFRRRFHRDPEV